MDFWLAWLLDICAGHSDNRQAIFEERTDGDLHAVFVDFGNMFSGPKGDQQPHFFASAYLDTRIYDEISTQSRMNLVRIAFNLDVDRLWKRAGMLPEEWKTASALQSFAICLETLANTQKVQSVGGTIAGFPRQTERREFTEVQSERQHPDSVLCPGVQGPRRGEIAAE